MKKHMKTLEIIANVVLWLFVAFAVLITVMVFAAQDADGVPSIGGKCTINIVSDSMSPTFDSGDLVFANKLSDAEKMQLKVNDIITFYADLDGDGNKELNTHRIVDFEYDSMGNVLGYYTKGDNPLTNPVRDEKYVTCANVICVATGTVWSNVGGFLSFLQTSLGFFLVIVLPLAAFFIYELVHFILTYLSMKNDTKKISAADEELIKQRAIEEYLKQQKEAQDAASASQAEETSALPSEAQDNE